MMASWYRLTSVRISPFCELARWILDRYGIAYRETCHAPIWNVPFTKVAGNTSNVPVIEAPDAVFEVQQFLEYLDARARPDEKLLPTDPHLRREADELTRWILEEVAIDVRLYAYAHMLPNRRVTSALMTANVPLWERAFVKLFYPLQAWAMCKALMIDTGTTEHARKQILAAFEKLSARMPSDGGFLVGDQITVVDLVFAASTAPITLPPEYGAPFPKLSDLPEE